MNHIYKIVFNKATGTMTAVAEFARAQGKGSLRTKIFRPAVFRLSLLVVALGLAGVTQAEVAAYFADKDTDTVAPATEKATAKTMPNRVLGIKGKETAAQTDTKTEKKDTDAKTRADTQNITTTLDANNNTVSVELNSHVRGLSSLQFADKQGIKIGDQNTSAMANSVAIGRGATVVSGDNPGIGFRQNPNFSTDHNTVAPTQVSQNIKVFQSINGVALGDKATAGKGATAIGGYAQAKGTYAVGVGSAVSAKGYNSVAVGQGAQATGNSTLSMGRESVASGSYATAIGNVASAIADGAFAVGHSAQATGKRTIAIGAVETDGKNTDGVHNPNGTRATADDAIALGTGTQAEGNHSLALGVKAKALKDHSMALGDDARATANISIAIGKNAGTTQSDAQAMGHFAHAGGTAAIAQGTAAVSKGGKSIAIGMQAATGSTQKTVDEIANLRKAYDEKQSVLTIKQNGYKAQVLQFEKNKKDYEKAKDNLATAKAELDRLTLAGAPQSEIDAARQKYTNAKRIEEAYGVYIPKVAKQLADSAAEVETIRSEANNAALEYQTAFDPAENLNAIAIGTGAMATSTPSSQNNDGIKGNSIAIGTSARANADNAIAIGRNADVDGVEQAVVIGDGAKSSAKIVDGARVTAAAHKYYGNPGTPTGKGLVEKKDSIDVIMLEKEYAAGSAENTSVAVVVGRKATAAWGGVAIGDHAKVEIDATTGAGEQRALGVAIGANATASGGSIAMGSSSLTEGLNNIAIGRQAVAHGDSAFAFGTVAYAEAEKSLAIGHSATTHGARAIAIGMADSIENYSDITNTQANSENSIALGSGALAGDKDIANNARKQFDAAYDAHLATIGKTKQTATDQEKLAAEQIAQQAKQAYLTVNPKGKDTIAIGTGAMAGSQKGSLFGEAAIAIGRGNRAFGTQSIAIGTGNQITGNYSGAFGDPSIILGAGSYTVGNDNAVGRTSTNVGAFGNNNQIGATATYNAQGKLQPDNGLTNTAQATGSRVVGNNNAINSENTFVLGNGINTAADGKTLLGNAVANSVYLGNDSSVRETAGKNHLLDSNTEGETTTGGSTGTVDSATVGNLNYGGFAGKQAVGAVSVGASGYERRIQNVAAGEISATSTDAINGSQLYLVTKGTLDQMPVVYTDSDGNKVYKKPDGTFVYADGSTIDPADVIASINNGAGSTTAPTNLANVAGSLTPTYNVGDMIVGADGKLTNNPKLDATKAQTAPQNLSNIYNNAATVGDVLNAGFNLKQKNGTANPIDKDFVKPFDTIVFADGNGTVVSVETQNATTNTIKYDVNVDNTSIKIVDGKLTAVATSPSTTSLVNNNGKVDKPNATDGNKLINAKDVANAINESGFFIKANDDAGQLIKPSNSVNLINGSNIEITRNQGNFTIKTKDNVEFKSIKIGDAANTTTITSTAKGLDIGGKKITNIADGDISATSTDAINGRQLHNLLNQTVAASKEVVSSNNKTVKVTPTVNPQTQATTFDLAVNVGKSLTVDNATGAIDVKTDGTTISTDPTTGAIKVNTGVMNIDNVTGKVVLNANDGNKLATIENVANAINDSGFNLTTSQSNGGQVLTPTNQRIKAGETLTLDAGKNMAITQMGNKVSLATKDEVEFVKVHANTFIVGNPAANSTTLTSDSNGLSVGGDRIGNVASGVSHLVKPVNTQAPTAAEKTDIANAIKNAQGSTLHNVANIGDLQAIAENVNKINHNVNNVINNLGDNLGKRISKVESKASAGISAAMAMASMPQAYIPGKSMFAVGLGTYNGQGAIAIGVSTVSDNGRWVIKAQGTADTKGNAGAAMGAGFHW